jgi:hypothetical protein
VQQIPWRSKSYCKPVRWASTPLQLVQRKGYIKEVERGGRGRGEGGGRGRHFLDISSITTSVSATFAVTSAASFLSVSRVEMMLSLSRMFPSDWLRAFRRDFSRFLNFT